MNKWHECEEYLNKLLNVASKDEKKLLLVMNMNTRLQGGEKYFDKVIKIDSTNVECYCQFGLLCDMNSLADLSFMLCCLCVPVCFLLLFFWLLFLAFIASASLCTLGWLLFAFIMHAVLCHFLTSFGGKPTETLLEYPWRDFG